jgi:hypothetical protein
MQNLPRSFAIPARTALAGSGRTSGIDVFDSDPDPDEQEVDMQKPRGYP